MGTEGKRLQTINRLINSIKGVSDKGFTVNRKKLTAEICITQGLTKRKAAEYIDLLIEAERVIEIDGELTIHEESFKE